MYISLALGLIANARPRKCLVEYGLNINLHAWLIVWHFTRKVLFDHADHISKI